jgi:hypothetical protein
LTGLLLIFSIGWYSSVRSLIVGQISPIIGFLLVWGIYLSKEKQDTGAGIVFALSTIKPVAGVFLIPFAILWSISKKRYSMLISFITSWLVLIGISLLFIPDWILPMLRQWLAVYGYADLRAPIELLGMIAPAIESSIGRALQISLLLYLLIEFFLAWGRDERWLVWGSAITLAISQLIVFRFSTTNHVVLLLPLLMVFKLAIQRWKAAGYLTVTLSVIGIFFGLWGLFLGTVDGSQESEWMYIAFPILCLILLWWSRWWALRASRLSLEIFASEMGE